MDDGAVTRFGMEPVEAVIVLDVEDHWGVLADGFVESIERLTPGPGCGLPALVATGQTAVHPALVTQRSRFRASLVNA